MKMHFIVLFLAFFLWIACAQTERKEEVSEDTAKEETTAVKEKTHTDKKILARVGGEPIYREDLKGRTLKATINDAILYQEGLRRGLDEKFEGRVEDYRRALIIESVKREFMADLLKDGEVSDEEIKQYYSENQENYSYIRIMEISTDDKDIAEEIYKKALEGKEFRDIASEYSKTGREVTVTDLKFNRRYEHLFEKREVGTISAITPEGNQFKIFKITAVEDVPLEKVKNAIRHAILAKRRGSALKDYTEKLKAQNNIEVEILRGKKESELN